MAVAPAGRFVAGLRRRVRPGCPPVAVRLWMPHAALHQHIGMRPAALLPVEWIFHGGVILAIATSLGAGR
jgi:hypothetical protein